MDLMVKAIMQDWAVLTPIFICSVLVVYVAINRIIYYKQNERNISDFIPNLQSTLIAKNIPTAQRISAQLGGIISEMVDEALRIYTEQKAAFQEHMTFHHHLQQEN